MQIFGVSGVVVADDVIVKFHLSVFCTKGSFMLRCYCAVGKIIVRKSGVVCCHVF